MRMLDILEHKRCKQELTDEEIAYFINGFTQNEIPDYQMASLLMAICLNGMTERETAVLTDCMAHSGDMLDLSDLGNTTADKHSTGGVGDKTTLIVAPICAAAGVKIAKMSGRGLGHTGGTIDKLESIPGFRIRGRIQEAGANHRACRYGADRRPCACGQKIVCLARRFRHGQQHPADCLVDYEQKISGGREKHCA